MIILSFWTALCICQGTPRLLLGRTAVTVGKGVPHAVVQSNDEPGRIAGDFLATQTGRGGVGGECGGVVFTVGAAALLLSNVSGDRVVVCVACALGSPLPSTCWVLSSILVPCPRLDPAPRLCGFRSLFTPTWLRRICLVLVFGLPARLFALLTLPPLGCAHRLALATNPSLVLPLFILGVGPWGLATAPLLSWAITWGSRSNT